MAKQQEQGNDGETATGDTTESQPTVAETLEQIRQTSDRGAVSEGAGGAVYADSLSLSPADRSRRDVSTLRRQRMVEAMTARQSAARRQVLQRAIDFLENCEWGGRATEEEAANIVIELTELRDAAPTPAARLEPTNRVCGSQGVDDDGHCLRCGLPVDQDCTEECPPGFFQGAAPVPAREEPTPRWTEERIRDCANRLAVYGFDLLTRREGWTDEAVAMLRELQRLVASRTPAKEPAAFVLCNEPFDQHKLVPDGYEARTGCYRERGHAGGHHWTFHFAEESPDAQ